MQDPAALFTLASTIKVRMADYYTANGYSLPAIQQVVTGTPAADCEKLAIQMRTTAHHQGNVALEQPDALGLGRATRFAVIVAYMLRCVPTVDARGVQPTTAQEEDAALEVLSDGTRMSNAVLYMLDNGYLPGCNDVVFDGWTNLDNQGGIGGGYLQFRVNLAGW